MEAAGVVEQHWCNRGGCKRLGALNIGIVPVAFCTERRVSPVSVCIQGTLAFLAVGHQCPDWNVQK